MLPPSRLNDARICSLSASIPQELRVKSIADAIDTSTLMPIHTERCAAAPCICVACGSKRLHFSNLNGERASASVVRADKREHVPLKRLQERVQNSILGCARVQEQRGTCDRASRTNDVRQRDAR